MKQKMKRKTLILILLFVLLTITAGGFSALYFSGIFSNTSTGTSTSAIIPKQLDNNGIAVNGAVESKTQEQVLEELQKEQINVTDKISSHILFPSGRAGTKGKWTVENPTSNNVIIQCEVYLDDRLIAKTVPIHPNQHITDIVLSANVASGVYDVTAYIHYYKTDSNEYISKAGYNLKLTVQ